MPPPPFDTEIVRAVVVELPAPSVAVIVTVRTPSEPYVCVTPVPPAPPPSPKFHDRDVPLNLSNALADMPTDAPGVATAGTSTAENTGAPPSNVALCATCLVSLSRMNDHAPTVFPLSS